MSIISSNFVNSPTSVASDNGDMISYTYTATGIKLSQALRAGKGGTSTRRDYAGPFVFVNNAPAWVSAPHGRFVQVNGSWENEFHLRDHLGNTRVVLMEEDTGTPATLQQNHYYPFGMLNPSLSTANTPGALKDNRYLYNGKELQDDFGLDWYDYGARFYDAQIGRWHVVGNLAEIAYDLTPYRYAQNNPIRVYDPDGNDDLFDIHGNFIRNTGAGTNILVDNKILSTIHFGGNLRVVSKIMTYYHREKLENPSTLRNNEVSVINQTGRGTERYNDVFEDGPYYYSTFAFGIPKNFTSIYKDNQIIVNLTKGSLSNYFDNYFNVISLMVHEDHHIKQGFTSAQYNTHTGFYELGAYIKQFSHWSFSGSTQDFKDHMIWNAVHYLNSYHSAGHSDFVNRTLTELNRVLRGHGRIIYNEETGRYEHTYN